MDMDEWDIKRLIYSCYMDEYMWYKVSYLRIG